MKSLFKTMTITTFSLMCGLHSNAQTLFTPGALVGTSPNGNVGINTGTNSPAFKLSVYTGSLNDGIQILQTGASAAALRLDNSSAGGRNWGILSTSTGNSQGGGKLLFYDYTGSVVRMAITGTGSVGVGLHAPLDKFHVHDGAIRITGGNPSGGPMVLFGGAAAGTNPATAPNGQWGIEYVESNPNPALRGLNFWRPNFAHNISGTGAGTQNAVMFLRNDNHVGINTDNPTAPLTVNGYALIGDPGVVTSLPLPAQTNGYRLYVQDGILTEKVKVALHNDPTNWADYVFAQDYKLMPIEKVESYVKANKHLPNVPSASDVVENGIDVAKMDATLLRQIEELWLHVIELKKENESLKAMFEKTSGETKSCHKPENK